MSRSTRGQQADNPIQLYIRWKGDTGELDIYNKETEERASAKKLSFLVLDELKAISGWNDGRIYSNEVHRLGEEPLEVMYKGNSIAKGLYTDIKSDVKSAGGKFTTVLYIKIEKDDRIARLELSGSSLSSWISFKNADKEYDGKDKPDVLKEGIRIVGPSEVKKVGKVEYTEPVFETFEPSEDEDLQAMSLDEPLQEYLNARGVKKVEETEEEEVQQPAVAAEAGDFEGEDDLPF